MKWIEFKQWMEQHGVTDETEIAYMDFRGDPEYYDTHSDGTVGVW